MMTINGKYKRIKNNKNMKRSSHLRSKAYGIARRRKYRNNLPLFNVETIAESNQTLADYQKSREMLRQAIY